MLDIQECVSESRGVGCLMGLLNRCFITEDEKNVVFSVGVYSDF